MVNIFFLHADFYCSEKTASELGSERKNVYLLRRNLIYALTVSSAKIVTTTQNKEPEKAS